MTTRAIRTWLVGLLAPVVMAVVGCGQGAPSPDGSATATQKGNKKGTETAANKADDHSGWWCAPHGIPEDECSMCSAKVAKACKAKGDWCDKHDRAKSQCFICDPSLREKFAAKYRAKFGQEPPPVEEETDVKN